MYRSLDAVVASGSNWDCIPGCICRWACGMGDPAAVTDAYDISWVGGVWNCCGATGGVFVAPYVVVTLLVEAIGVLLDEATGALFVAPSFGMLVSGGLVTCLLIIFFRVSVVFLLGGKVGHALE